MAAPRLATGRPPPLGGLPLRQPLEDKRAMSPMEGALDGVARDEELLGSLGEGQARMELELLAIREDLAQLRGELLSQRPGRSLWWREMLSDAAPRQTRPHPEGASVKCRIQVPPDSDEEAPAADAKGVENNVVVDNVVESNVVDNNAVDKGERSVRAKHSSPDSYLPPSLPADWPACVQGRDVALVETSEVKPQLRSSATQSFVDEEGPEEPKSWALDPNSNISLAIASGTLVVLCHDMFMIPFVVAWELPLEGAVLMSTMVSCLYWTLDMFLGFVMGYPTGEEVEMRLPVLARRYAATWFVPDAVVVCADWFNIVVALSGDMNGTTGASKLLRFAKLGKMLRLLGLVRMMKVVKVFEEFIANSLSELSRMAVWALRFFLGVVWVCHLMCCGWFAVGRADSDTGMRWTDGSTSQGSIELPFMEANQLYQYVTALHWSLAQFALGAIEIPCYNSYERLFNMLCIFIGLIGGSVIVGSFSATMVDYQMRSKETSQKLSKLRRYLRENGKSVSKQTAKQVQLQAVERLKLKEKLQERDVTVLNVVSSALKSELRFEIFAPLLNTHGLFQVWVTLDRAIMRRVCDETLAYNSYRPQDEIFVAGSSSDTAYHIASGDVVYHKDPETAPVAEQEEHAVTAGSWLAEGSLWTRWMHVGTAKTVGRCDVLSVSSAAVEMVQNHPQVGSITKHYAKQFFKCIVESGPPQSAYPDDREVPHAQFDEIVSGCEPSVQRAVSLHLLHRARNRLAGGSQELQDEIRQGKSCVVLDKQGRLQRMVSVVVLELMDGRGRLMVEVAKRDKLEDYKASCQLPAKKQAQGEASVETLRTILGKLGSHLSLKDMELKGPSREVQQGKSDRFGLETKYLRKVYSAVCRDTSALGLPVRAPWCSSEEQIEEEWPSKEHAFAKKRSSLMARLPSKEELPLDTVPLLADQEGRALLAWLPTPFYEHLRSPQGKPALQAWVDSLNRVDLEASGAAFAAEARPGRDRSPGV